MRTNLWLSGETYRIPISRIEDISSLCRLGECLPKRKSEPTYAFLSISPQRQSFKGVVQDSDRSDDDDDDVDDDDGTNGDGSDDEGGEDDEEQDLDADMDDMDEEPGNVTTETAATDQTAETTGMSDNADSGEEEGISLQSAA